MLLQWVRALWHEVMNPASSVLDGTRLGDQQSALVMRCPDDEEFSEWAASIQIVDNGLGAHVTDAKALYDLLHRRSGNAGQDRRAQIDVAVICVSARALRISNDCRSPDKTFGEWCAAEKDHGRSSLCVVQTIKW